MAKRKFPPWAYTSKNIFEDTSFAGVLGFQISRYLVKEITLDRLYEWIILNNDPTHSELIIRVRMLIQSYMDKNVTIEHLHTQLRQIRASYSKKKR